MPVSYIRLTSQINCGDVTILNQERLSLVTTEKSIIVLAELSVQDIKQRVRNKIIHSLPGIMIFGSLVMRCANDFDSWLRHSWKLLANCLTRDPKIVFHSWSDLPMIFTRDFVTRENYWQIASLVTQNRYSRQLVHYSLFIYLHVYFLKRRLAWSLRPIYLSNSLYIVQVLYHLFFIMVVIIMTLVMIHLILVT